MVSRLVLTRNVMKFVIMGLTLMNSLATDLIMEAVTSWNHLASICQNIHTSDLGYITAGGIRYYK